MAQVSSLPAVARPRPELPARLRRKVGQAVTAWFEQLSGSSRSLYRRGVVDFGCWLAAEQAIVLPKEVPAGTPARQGWEDDVCTAAGQYLLAFPFHEAVHLVEAYLRDRLFEEPKLSRSTVTGRLAALRWAAREARRQNLISWDLEGAKVPRPRKDKHGRMIEKAGRDMRGPDPSEKQLLLRTAAAEADPRVGLCIAMMLNEGYREHEIRQLDFTDVDLANEGVWMVRKKRDERELYPLSKVTMIQLRRWLAMRGDGAGPLFVGGRFDRARTSFSSNKKPRIAQKALFRWVRKACSAASIRFYSPHKLRHRACTDIVDWGVRMGIPEERILFLTGHSDRASLKPYYEHSKDATPLRDLLDAASGSHRPTRALRRRGRAR